MLRYQKPEKTTVLRKDAAFDDDPESKEVQVLYVVGRKTHREESWCGEETPTINVDEWCCKKTV